MSVGNKFNHLKLSSLFDFLAQLSNLLSRLMKHTYEHLRESALITELINICNFLI
jgi:hypothetical protein